MADVLEADDKKIKISLLGVPSVGKTSIIKRITDDAFTESYMATLGADFTSKKLSIPSKTGIVELEVQITEIGGQSIFEALVTKFLHGTICVIFVFDLSDPSTLDGLHSWLEKLIIANVDKDVESILLIGNKSDLTYNKEEVKIKANQFLQHAVKKIGYPIFSSYIETSAATYTNVEEAFNLIGKHIVDNLKN
ncbi:MAG: GTP-binding protein [Candidatus Heimdallarchaeota archaeon]|nr:GTP-binding protein [Candidatus Heimdallarchaeota archaeon]